MKLILLIALAVFGCQKKEPKSYDSTLEDVRAKLEFYKTEAEPIETYTERCDLLTFKGLWDAYGVRGDIYDHEYEPGEWHRDVKPCFPGDSRSEISTEGVLGALHAMNARGDYDKVQDLWSYLEDNDWVAGLGPEQYTNVLQLKPLVKEMLEKSGHLSGSKHKVLRFAGSDDSTPGYRGNVLADYIALHALALGYLKSWHVAAVEQLASEVPQSPLYQALFGCYSDENAYQTALNILGSDELFPSDRLPERSNEGLWDWSDGPQLPMIALTLAVLEHCSE